MVCSVKTSSILEPCPKSTCATSPGSKSDTAGGDTQKLESSPESRKPESYPRWPVQGDLQVAALGRSAFGRIWALIDTIPILHGLEGRMERNHLSPNRDRWLFLRSVRKPRERRGREFKVRSGPYNPPNCSQGAPRISGLPRPPHSSSPQLFPRYSRVWPVVSYS